MDVNAQPGLFFQVLWPALPTVGPYARLINSRLRSPLKRMALGILALIYINVFGNLDPRGYNQRLTADPFIAESIVLHRSIKHRKGFGNGK